MKWDSVLDSSEATEATGRSVVVSRLHFRITRSYKYCMCLFLRPLFVLLGFFEDCASFPSLLSSRAVLPNSYVHLSAAVTTLLVRWFSSARQINSCDSFLETQCVYIVFIFQGFQIRFRTVWIPLLVCGCIYVLPRVWLLAWLWVDFVIRTLIAWSLLLQTTFPTFVRLPICLALIVFCLNKYPKKINPFWKLNYYLHSSTHSKKLPNNNKNMVTDTHWMLSWVVSY